MITKILAWSSFGTMLLFAVLALVSLYAWEDLGETGPMLVWFGALPLLVTSILLAVAILVVSAFDSGSSTP
jgi:hypothetical protein